MRPIIYYLIKNGGKIPCPRSSELDSRGADLYGPVGFRKNVYLVQPCNYYLLRERRRIDERFRMHAY